MAFTKGNKLGKKFGQGQVTTKGGRSKKLITEFKDKGYSKAQVRQLYSIVFGLPANKLEEIVKDKTTEAGIAMAASAFLKAIKLGDYRVVKDIVELFADKAKQSTEISGPDGSPIETKIISFRDLTEALGL